MTKHTHTPGPWPLETVKTSIGTCHKIGKFPSRGAHSETSACVYADSIHEYDIGHSKVGDELLANARLISAAPELLQALVAWVESTSRANETGSMRPVYDLAVAAIAKARGP